MRVRVRIRVRVGVGVKVRVRVRVRVRLRPSALLALWYLEAFFSASSVAPSMVPLTLSFASSTAFSASSRALLG